MKKQRIIIFICLILISVTIITIFITEKINTFKEKEENLNENQKVCFMPRDCFETQKEYLNQFPGKEEPKYFSECLVHCTKEYNNLPKLK